jgi:predicted transcriptional regulator
MKTVQMTLDEALVREVDRVAKRLGTTRSAFARQALREALKRLGVRELEARQRDGYARKPLKTSEFAAWEGEQVWPDDSDDDDEG